MSVKRAGRLAGPLLIALILLACGPTAATPAPTTVPTPADTPAPTTVPIDLAGTSWLLVGYTSPAGRTFTVPMSVTPALVFGVGTVDGVAGCNTFSGRWTLQGEALSLDGLTWTEAGCPEPGATVEKAYLANIVLVDRVALEGERLVLTQSDGLAALEFVPAGV